MSLPTLGPVAPVAAPEFQPIPTTQPAPRPSAVMPAVSGYHQPGTSRNPLSGISSEPYTPPEWARTINVADPAYTPASPGSSANGYVNPGLPERVTVNPFAGDPIREFLGDKNTQMLLGAAPGDQRGGSYYGLATTPMTLANFSTWGREGVLAAALDFFGQGDAYQQPEGARFGEQPTGPADGGGPVDWFTKGAVAFGDVVWKAVDAPMKWFRDSNAFNRAKNIRELFQTGDADGFVVERITSAIFGGSERFTMDGLRQAAARRGMDVIDVMADLYDMPRDKVAAIAANPWITDQALGQISDGTPLSKDPVSNLALEGGMLLATMAVGGAGLARAGAVAGRSGIATLEALGAGVRGVQLAEGATAAARAAGALGSLTRRAMQLNSWNTVAGWSIRGAEVGIKQLAIIGGNDELVKAMDRMLWTMPLSMNPGWNLIDGFSSHPIDAYRNLRSGQVAIGRPTSPGYVGQLDLKGGALRDGEGRAMTITVAGRQIQLGSNAEEFKVLGRLRDLTPEQLHASFFQRLGWSLEDMNRLFGEGNPYDGLTWDAARNGLFHAALEAVRESKGAIGRNEGLHLPTYAQRTSAFIRDNARGAMKMLDRNLTGEGDEMVRLFMSDFWDLAKRNDTRMGEAKAYLGDTYDPALALSDFGSWLRASKIVHEAIKGRIAGEAAVPAYRQSVNRDFVARWRNQLAERFGPDDVVPVQFINQLKRFGGNVEARGRGSELVRGRVKGAVYTRKRLEEILDDVERADDVEQRRANTMPHTQAAAYRKDFDPGQDPLEDARVAGIGPSDLQTIRRAQASTPDQLTSFPPPRLLAKVAKAQGRSADALRQGGPEAAWRAVFKWLDTRLAQAAETGHVRTVLDRTADTFAARAAEGRMGTGVARLAVAGLHRIRDEILAPLDPKAAANRPGLWREWDTTRQEAILLAGELERHVDDPLARVRVAEPVPGQAWMLPPDVPADALTRYAALARRIASPDNPAITEADRALLLDPAVHPFAKAEVMRRSVSPGDMTELARLEREIGGTTGRPEDVLLTALNDLEPRAPEEPPHTFADALDVTGRAVGYAGQGEELAARAAMLARRFDQLGGSWSDELSATMDRLAGFQPQWRKQAPKGAPRDINRVAMDPETPGRNAARVRRDQIAAADRRVADAEARVARAQRAVDDPATYTPPSVAEVEQGQWLPVPGMRFTQGDREAKKAAAEQAAAEHTRATGRRTYVTIGSRNVATVHELVPPREVPPAPAPGTVGLPSWATEAGVRRFDQEYLAGRDQYDLESNGILLGIIQNPGVADADLAGLRRYAETEAERLRADLAANQPVGTGVTDPRTQLLSDMDARLEAFRNRDAKAQAARVDSTPLAEGPGGTAPPRADVSTQPGALEEPGQPSAPAADAMTPEAPVETATMRFRANRREAPDDVVKDAGPVQVLQRNPSSFPDPDTGAPVPFRIALAEADDLTTSADPLFDPELQPRMRAQRTASDQQIAGIQTSIRPKELLTTDSGAQGMPVVLDDGQVIAGNGRVTGLRGLTGDNPAVWRAAVDDAAESLGLSTEGMRNPVLVRIIDVPHDEAVRLATQLNFETGMPPADRALGLSRLITDADLDRLRVNDGEALADAIRASRNDDFVERFLGHIPQQHRGSYLLPDGGLNEDGINLVVASLFGRFTNASRDPLAQQLLVDLFEGQPDVRTLASGLDAAGMLIAAQVESSGRSYATVIPSFAADLVPALQRVFGLRAGVSTMRDVRTSLMSAGELFADELTPLTPAQQALALDLTMMGSAAEFRTFLRTIANSVRHSDADQMGMFGGPELPPPSYPGVVNEAIGALNRKRGESDQLMRIPEATGETIVRDGTGVETARIIPVQDDPAVVREALAPVLVDIGLEGDDWSSAAATIARSTGTIELRLDTQAEVDWVSAYLRGEGPPLPRNYRVEDDAIVPLGDIRGEIADRITGRYRSPANVKGFVDSELAFRQGPRPVAENPHLPGVRAALEGRQWTVRLAGQAEAADTPRTTFVSRTARTIDPEEERVVGLPPDTTPEELAARASADAGEHRIAGTADEHTERAEQRAAGAPTVHQPSVIERNRPDADARRKVAEEALAQERAKLDDAKAKRERLGTDPGDGPPPADILGVDDLALWHRYTSDSTTIARPAAQPATIGDVVRALESLDLGLPPVAGAMSDAELQQLRQSLMRVLHSRLTDLGAPPEVPAGARRNRAGPGVRHGIGTRPTDEPVLTTPEDLSADLAEVMRQLQTRVYEAEDPLAGWEGTQYEIGALPAKGRDGGPLAPRIQYDEWVDRAEELVPGLGEELLHGRKRAWTEREQDARFAASLRNMPGMRRLASLADTAFGSRPEKDIARQAIDRFTEELLKRFTPADGDQYDEAVRQVHGIVDAVHEWMRGQTVRSFQRYRRIGLVPPDKFEEVALKAFGVDRPQWLNDLILESEKAGIKHPLAEAWRRADNRVRAYFGARSGGISEYLDKIYGRRASELGRNMTVGYHLWRFLVDVRWLALEVLDAPVLTLFREGPGAVWEAMGKGKNAGKTPMFMGKDAAESMRTQWAWWMANSDPGAFVRTRERYLLSVVRRTQEQEFPRAVDAFVRAMERAGTDMADLRGAMRLAGDTPMDWLRKLDADWELAAKRTQPLSPQDAVRLLKPWKDKGIISAREYDEMVKAGRYTGHPAIDAELANLADPRVVTMLERLAAINEQGWHDAAQLIFGQTDRSNLQRLANHPLLYWPVSYQIKATKWLASVLFDRAFGYDTGAGGAVTLGMLHQQHKDRLASDPEYAQQLADNPTLLFAAQMLFPIAPWDMGVSLSPMTRLALAMATNDDPATAYRRNVLAVGPGYTYFQLLPRLLYEQAKEGSALQQAGLGGVVERLQYAFPYSIPIKPSTSQLAAADQQAYGQQPLPAVPPFQVPSNRYP